MPRPNVTGRGAIVVTLAFVVLACTGNAPSPSTVATARPTPSPVKSVDLGAFYANAMIEAFAEDPLVLHVDQTMKATASYDTDSTKIDATASMDLSDRDLNVRMVTKAAGKTTKADLIVIGTSVYARTGSGKWTKGSRSNYEQNISDLLRALQPVRNPAHLRYVGVETVDQRKLHHLTAVKTFPYVMTTGQTGTYDTFDIWVEDDGTPVLSKGEISAIGAYGIEIKGTSELRFSKFGGTITVAAPKL